MSDTDTNSTESVAPIEVALLNFGKMQWPYACKAVKIRQKEKGTDGKSKMVEKDHPVVGPVIESAIEAANFASGVIMAAEVKAPGAGLKLFNAIFASRIQDASDEAFDSKTGEHDEAKIIEHTLASERPRSSGQKLEDINKLVAELVPELIQLGGASEGDKWTSLVNPVTNERLFATKDAYALRLVAVQTELQKLLAVKAQKEERQKEIRLKKEAKAQAAKEALAKAAAPTPAPAH
jgi:hypothetical protein